MTPASAGIQSLAGSGNVVLGAKTLALTNAHDTFAGAISGAGGLTLASGTQTLTGTSNYTGTTNVTGGELRLESGGQITSTSGLTINGPNATATVTGAGSLLQTTGSLIFGNSAGTNATFNIENGGAVRAVAGSVLSFGALQTAAVNVNGPGSLLELSGVLSVGNGQGSAALVNVTNGGAIRSGSGVIGGNVTTADIDLVTVSGAGSSWTMTGSLSVRNGSLRILDGGLVSAASANLIFASSNGILVSGAGSTLSVVGNVDAGTSAGATITLADDGRMSSGGQLRLGFSANTTGVLNIGGGEGQAATGAGTLNAATLTFGPGTGRLNFNHTDTNYIFATAMSGAGTINHTGPGLTHLTADSSAFTGITSISAGTLAVNGSLCGGMNVLAGGRLQGTGTVCDTGNAGVVAPGNSIGTLTVSGNYAGNGGRLEIESVLGGDASPTDRLVVTGDTSGATLVRVINLGGAGAATSEGIKVIDVGGASAGAFSLQGDYIIAGEQAVIAGAYAYTLQKNGVSTPTDGDWYLRSSLTNVPVLPGLRPPPFQPGSPSTPSDTSPPSAGSPPPGSPGPQVPAGPLYQPGVPLYESYSQVLLGMNELSTLRERVGNRHRGEGDAMAQMGPVKAVASAPASIGPVWGRFEGRHLNLNPSSTARSSFDADYLKFEAGIDAVTFDQGLGKLVFGITGHYNEADADVSSFFGNGSIRTRGGGFGGTATWYGYDGFYVDGQARASWYSSKLNSVLVGPVISDNDGFGYALGLETGKRFALINGWSLTPQAQLTYGAVDFDTFTDRFGARVSLGHAASLLGRAGISLDHQTAWRDASGRLMRSDIYGIANLHYEFLDGASVDVSGTRFASSADRLWGGIGAGGTFSWANDRYAIYGEVSYNTSLEDTGVNYSYKGTAGFRVRW